MSTTVMFPVLKGSADAPVAGATAGRTRVREDIDPPAQSLPAPLPPDRMLLQPMTHLSSVLTEGMPQQIQSILHNQFELDPNRKILNLFNQ